MDSGMRGWRRLFRLPLRSRGHIRDDVDEELQCIIDARTADLIDHGVSPAEARVEALRHVGMPFDAARDVLHHSAERREKHIRMRDRVDEWGQDLKYATRSLRKAPGFVLVVVLTLALGIGANATVFTWMEGLVLNPIPTVKDARALVALMTVTPGGGTQSVSYPDYLDWRSASRTLGDIVIYRRQWCASSLMTMTPRLVPSSRHTRRTTCSGDSVNAPVVFAPSRSFVRRAALPRSRGRKAW